MIPEIRDKINIIDFCKDPQLLNLPLLDTQEVILRAMYGLPMDGEQKILLKTLIGGRLPKLGVEHQETVLILGGRSGKTRLVAAIACYEACSRDWTKYIRPGEMAWCFVMATREQQAIDIGRNMIFSMLRSSPVLKSLIVDSIEDATRAAFPRSKAGVIALKTGMAITALPCSSTVGRGYPIAICILDEVAFFARESKNDKTDYGIYDSVLPRMIQFDTHGKMLLISTPADKSGLLYDKWINRKKHSKLYFMLKSPTWRIRTDYNKEFFERHRKLSPDGYIREFGAEFTESLAPYIPAEDVAKVVREEPLVIEPTKEDTLYFIGIDTAFGDRDRFGLSVGHSEEIDGEFKVVIDLAEKIESNLNEDLIDVALNRLVEVCKSYRCDEVIADQYQSDAFGKLLEERGVIIRVESWTAGRRRSCYGRLRALIKRQAISLPDCKDLLDEIMGLEVRYMPNSGQYTIHHKLGGHDDVADSTAIVAYELGDDEIGNTGVQFF